MDSPRCPEAFPLAKVMCIQGGNVIGKSNQLELLLDLLMLMLILQLLNPLNQSS